jgi:hypothetical protein
MAVIMDISVFQDLTPFNKIYRFVTILIYLSQFWTSANHPVFYLKTQRLGDLIMSPSSGGTYPDGPHRKS